MNKIEILDKLTDMIVKEHITPDELVEAVLDILVEEGKLI